MEQIISKQQKKTQTLYTIIFLLVYLYPISMWNAYIPYVLIGVMFLVAIFQSGGVIRCRNDFFWFSFYAFISNIILYPLMHNASIIEAVQSSLFILIPFFAIQIGKNIRNRTSSFDFSRIVFLLICVEFFISCIQSFGGTLGLRMMQMYGGDKYSLTYAMAGSRIRSIGTFGNPNALGVGMLIFLVIVLCSCKKKSIRVCSIVLTTVVILASLSRTAFLVELITMVLIYGGWFDSRVSAVKKIRNLILVAISIYILFELYGMFVGRDLSTDSLQDRVLMWKRIFDSVKDNSTARTIIGTLAGQGVSYVKSMGPVDNEYVHLLVSTGIIGSVMYVVSLLDNVRVIHFMDSDDKKICIIHLVIWLLTSVTASFFMAYIVSFMAFVYWGYALENTYRPRELAE